MTKHALLLFAAPALVLLLCSGHALAADATLQNAWVYKCEQQLNLNETIYADEYMVRLVDVSSTLLGALLTLDLYQRGQFIGRLSLYEGQERTVSDLKIVVKQTDAKSKSAVLRLERLEEVRTYEKVAELSLEKGESAALPEYGIESITLVDIEAGKVNVSVVSGAGTVERVVRLGGFVEVDGLRLEPELFGPEQGSVLFGVYASASPNLSVAIVPAFDEDGAVLTYTVEVSNRGGADALTLAIEHGSSLSKTHTERLKRLNAHKSVRYTVSMPVALEPARREVSLWADVVAYDAHQRQIEKRARAKLVIPSCISITKAVVVEGGFPQSETGRLRVELSLSSRCTQPIEVELTDGLPNGFYTRTNPTWRLTLFPHTTVMRSYEADITPTTIPARYTAPPATLVWHLNESEGTIVSSSVQFKVHGPHIATSWTVGNEWVELVLTNVGDEDAMKVNVHVPVDTQKLVDAVPQPQRSSDGITWNIQKIVPSESVLVKYALEGTQQDTPRASITFYGAHMKQLGSTQSSYNEPSPPAETPAPPTPSHHTERRTPDVAGVLSYMAFVLALLGIPALVMLWVMRW
ncbi:MAG: hypothetical protein ACXQS1_05430 [Methermicoccaceae archaeon]